jgi:hypothetical protein
MFTRKIQQELSQVAAEYPVVTIIGPRQSGKTTLAKMQFPGYRYANLEIPEIRKLATEDPNDFFSQYPAPVIIDEIQRVPELLSYLQALSDNATQPGQYILTGSHQVRLHETVSQSLAGRTALLSLLPLSIEELKDNNTVKIDRDSLIYRGFMPQIYQKDLNPTRLYRNYFQTYIERDVRQMINVKSLIAFENFMRLLAGRIGQVVNLHSMASDIGVSSSTLKEWLSVLEASFVIFRLPPYFENFGKRIIKSPKIFFTEVGLAAYLLGLETAEQVSRDPLRGNLFENMVVIEALKARLNAGVDPNLFFFRDSKGYEIDLIFKKGRQLVPVEIKSAMTFNSGFAKNIETFSKIAPNVETGAVIYAGELTPKVSGNKFVHFSNTASVLV